MLAQKTGGSIINITTTLVEHPIAGINSAVPMITKGGLEAITRSLAMEYVKQGIRVNAVAPGTVDTPMHKDHLRDFLKTLQPMGRITDVKDIVDAIVYLTEAGQVRCCTWTVVRTLANGSGEGFGRPAPSTG
jgi:NAD(P)-dependent dehydrogenase (short-subunit alcohol dehydrogenase family)